MPSALDRRFQAFLASLPGAEALDDVLAGPQFDGQRRADFLLFDRRVIVEVKSLEVDPSGKVESEMERHRDRHDFPLWYGEVDVQKVLKHLPDGQNINDRLFDKITRPVETAFRSAEDQIANTVKLLSLSDAASILVLLNQDIDILEPKIVLARLSQLLLRKDRTGSPRSPIAVCWIIFESHVITSAPVPRTIPLVTLLGPRSDDYPWFSELFANMQFAWAELNGISMVHQEADTFDGFHVASTQVASLSPSDGKLSRQEWWELRYETQPYLRPLSDEQVLEFGAVACNALMPHFLIDGTKLPERELERQTVAWTHFLCEARHRGLDLRKMPRS